MDRVEYLKERILSIVTPKFKLFQSNFRGVIQSLNWKNLIQRFLIILALYYVFGYRLLYGILIDTDQKSYLDLVKSTSQTIYLQSIFIISLYLARIFNRSTLIKLFFSYFGYLIISYFLLITRNINNPDFKIDAYLENHFWQTNSLLSLAIIIIIAVIIRYVVVKYIKLKTIKNFIKEYSPTISITYWLPTLFVVTDERVLDILRDNVSNFLTSDGFTSLIQYLLSTLIVIQLFTGLIVASFFQSIRRILKNQSSLSLAIITSALIALILNYYLQLGVLKEEELLNRYIFPGATLFQILFLMFFALLIYVIVNRYVISTIIIISISIAMSIANSMKFSMRNEPLLITDFTWLSNPFQIFEFAGDNNLIIILIGLIIVFGLVIKFKNRILPNKIIEPVQLRILIFFALLGTFTITTVVFKTEKESKLMEGVPILSRVNNFYDIEWYGFAANARYKSLAYVWTKQLTKTIMEKPDNYSQSTIENLVKKYEKRAKEINNTRSENISDQTVIFILSESFSDPRRVEGVTISKNVTENIDEIKSKTTSGLMKSDGYGGGTANMEFQTLTGLPYYNLSPSVSVMMTEVFPKMSTVPSISDQFDRNARVIIHPAGASSYNRNNVYSELGFEKQLFLWGGGSEKLENIQTFGTNVSDESTFQNVLDNIDVSKNQFFSVITMQNHTPWTATEPKEISAVGDGFSNIESTNLNSYVKMLDKTDQQVKQFLDKLEKIDKKVTVVFYGDHLPGFYPEKAFRQNPESQYQTDYFIWSNYQTVKKNHPLVNSSDFSAELLEHTNSKVSPYYALLTDILHQTLLDDKELSAKQKEIAQDLKIVQYDITLGNNYLNKSKDFFDIE
ncbi:LTA synthase family protein [Streptococcus suis]|uniref:LTA synthase family protein n=1 Tax=Streptococcus suis TaxID=1307 RepID=UPI000CF5BFC4|nr:alkaline phosphatase family protein [Streptococcus suis]HEM2808816.1 sulfatase-like hydrolase/transferase [Streptococcus suis]